MKNILMISVVVVLILANLINCEEDAEASASSTVSSLRSGKNHNKEGKRGRSLRNKVKGHKLNVATSFLQAGLDSRKKKKAELDGGNN